MKAVIFDLDGTLADTLESIAYCCNLAIGRYGFSPIEQDRYRYMVGEGAVTLIERVLEAAGDKELVCYEKVKAAYDEIFKQDCMYEVKPYDGICETLQKLKESGIRLAVLSNKPHYRALDVVHMLFGESMFDAVLGQTPEMERKPDPAGVFALANGMGVELKDILYVGDTCTDMQTGKSAGVFTIGVLWGFRDREELEENHADAIIAHPLELLSFL